MSPAWGGAGGHTYRVPVAVSRYHSPLWSSSARAFWINTRLPALMPYGGVAPARVISCVAGLMACTGMVASAQL